MIRVEYALVDEPKFEVDPLRAKMLYIKRVAQFSSDGYNEAEVLQARGHKNLRVIMDTEWEMSITCDDCRLWACITRSHPLYRLSENERSGALLEVLQCDPKELRRRFGKRLTAEDVLNLSSDADDPTIYGAADTDDKHTLKNRAWKERRKNEKRTKESGG